MTDPLLWFQSSQRFGKELPVVLQICPLKIHTYQRILHKVFLKTIGSTATIARSG